MTGERLCRIGKVLAVLAELLFVNKSSRRSCVQEVANEVSFSWTCRCHILLILAFLGVHCARFFDIPEVYDIGDMVTMLMFRDYKCCCGIICDIVHVVPFWCLRSVCFVECMMFGWYCNVRMIMF